MTAPDMALSVALNELAALDRPALAERWSSAFDCPAPRSCQAPLLRSALAWQLQLTHNPEWSDAAVRKLVRSLRSSTPAVQLAPGTRLLREWQGHTHQVTVLAQGYEYDGSRYRSLTAIARAITGTPWSGPLFVGLRS